MLTDYITNPTPDSQPRVGYKAFIYGSPDVCLHNRWLRSTQGPGFHVFIDEAAAREYAAGVGFAVVHQVLYRHVLLTGHEGKWPAVTAEYLLIKGNKEPVC